MRLRVTDRFESGGTPGPSHGRRRSADPTLAFTLIEIAICLGVIAFALVAIIGILPAGLQVQRDNREDTIMNQDGTYLLETIRNGAEGVENLSNRVRLIVISNVTDAIEEFRFTNDLTKDVDRLTAKQIVGLLSTPSDVISNKVWEVRAIMYAGAGAAGTLGTELDFEFQATIRNFPYTNYGPGAQTLLSRYFRDVRVDTRWPVLSGDRVGIGRHNFRGQFSGVMDQVNDPKLAPVDLWFLRQ